MAYTDKLRVVYGDYTLGVHGEGFDYIFSYAQGGLESIVKNGYEWLYRCPKPTFWRALTDNDRGSKFHIKSGSWLSADMFIDCKGIQVIMDGKEQNPYAPDNNSYGGDVYADEIIVKYTYETITTPATTVLVSYSVDASGKIRVDVHYNGVQGLPEFPVFGMRFIMPTLADKYLYKGLSGETYPDRKAGAQEGVYEIGDLSLTQYLVPQECGMRMDTEWLEITRHTALDNSRTDSSSQTLRIEKNDEKFAFSCLPYTASEIENALHHEEPPPARRTGAPSPSSVFYRTKNIWATSCFRKPTPLILSRVRSRRTTESSRNIISGTIILPLSQGKRFSGSRRKSPAGTARSLLTPRKPKPTEAGSPANTRCRKGWSAATAAATSVG